MFNDEARLDYLRRERMVVLRSLDKSNLEEKALSSYKVTRTKQQRIVEIRSAIRAMQIWLKDIEGREASLRAPLSSKHNSSN